LFFKDCRRKHAPYSSWFKATYNLFLDDAIAQIDAELRQQKRARLLQREKLTNIKGDRL
jgi:hypothetical protein